MVVLRLRIEILDIFFCEFMFRRGWIIYVNSSIGTVSIDFFFLSSRDKYFLSENL